MKQQDTIVLVHPNGTRERVYDFSADTERIVYDGRWYKYIGTQEGERVYREEES